MAQKYTLASGADMYAQNGSTEFKVITSTGDVIGGAIKYGNSSDNTVIDSSGNIEVNGVIYNTSTNAVIVDSSGNVVLNKELLAKSTGTAIIDSSGNYTINKAVYPASTAGHVIIDSSGNILLGSSGKLFADSTTAQAIDSSGNFVLGSSGQYFAGTTNINVIDSTGNIMVNGVIYNASSNAVIVDSSGHIQINNALYGASTAGHVICDSSGNLLLGSSGKLFAQTTDSTGCAVNSSGELLYRGYDLRAIQTLTSGAGSSASAITGYGITIHNGDTGGSISMSAPVYTGVRKTIVFTQGSTIARSINSSETTGSTDNDLGFSFYSTAATNSSAITLSTGSTLACTIELLGISTQQWLLLHEDSTLSNITIATT